MELTILLLTVLPISVFGLRVPKEHFSYEQGSSAGSEAKAGSMIEVGCFWPIDYVGQVQQPYYWGFFLAAYLFLELKKTLKVFFR